MFEGIFILVLIAAVVFSVFTLLNHFFKGKKRVVQADSENDAVGSLEEYKFKYRNIKDD